MLKHHRLPHSCQLTLLKKLTISTRPSWSYAPGVSLSPATCIEILFSFRPGIFSYLIPCNSLSASLQYSIFAKYINDNLFIFMSDAFIQKYRKLCYNVRRLRSYISSQKLVLSVIDACIFPIFLYCSPTKITTTHNPNCPRLNRVFYEVMCNLPSF